MKEEEWKKEEEMDENRRRWKREKEKGKNLLKQRK